MIYIGSPFSHEEKAVEAERYRDVMAYTANLIKARLIAFSPIVHCYHMHLAHKLPGDANYWERFNKDILRFAEVLHVLKLDGWEKSRGLKQEISFAKLKTIPIIYIEGQGLWRENSKIG